MVLFSVPLLASLCLFFPSIHLCCKWTSAKFEPTEFNMSDNDLFLLSKLIDLKKKEKCGCLVFSLKQSSAPLCSCLNLFLQVCQQETSSSCSAWGPIYLPSHCDSVCEKHTGSQCRLNYLSSREFFHLSLVSVS